MANYRSSVSGKLVTSEATLGYPWIEVDEEGTATAPQKEIMARTADAILADVGDDPVLAQEALTAEQARETPRKVLTARLKAIIAAGEES